MQWKDIGLLVLGAMLASVCPVALDLVRRGREKRDRRVLVIERMFGLSEQCHAWGFRTMHEQETARILEVGASSTHGRRSFRMSTLSDSTSKSWHERSLSFAGSGRIEKSKIPSTGSPVSALKISHSFREVSSRTPNRIETSSIV